MSDVSFPIRDLTRRKFQTSVTIIGLTICFSGTLFLVIVGGKMGFEMANITRGGQLTSGFSSIFSRFVLVVSSLNIGAIAFVTSFLVHLTMSKKTTDIGVMKATGCLSGSIFVYFLTELTILILTSCVLGTIIGVGSHYLSVYLINSLGYSYSPTFNVWSIPIVFFVYTLASYIPGTLLLIRATKLKPAEALSPSRLHRINVRLRRANTRTSFTRKVAYRSLMRRKNATYQAIFCLAAVFTLITVTTAGGMIANQTTRNYVEKAIGKDVLLLGHPSLVERYTEALSSVYIPEETQKSFDYLNPEFFFPESSLIPLREIGGVHKIDPRIIFETPVFEIPGVIPDPNDPLSHLVIGDNRRDQALILGITPDTVINEWLFIGKALGEGDQKAAFIGDTLAVNMFDNPLNQSVKILEQTFDITGVCLDPLNNGKVVYLHLDAVDVQTMTPGYNLVLLKVDAEKHSQVVAEVKKALPENLELTDVDPLLSKHRDFLNTTWSVLMVLPLSSVVTAALCLLSYLMLSITSLKREFGIMRALGARPRTIMNIILYKALFITILSGVIGISAGLCATFLFLIPEPVVSGQTLIAIVGFLVVVICLLCFSSLFPAIRIIRDSVIDAVQTV